MAVEMKLIEDRVAHKGVLQGNDESPELIRVEMLLLHAGPKGETSSAITPSLQEGVL